MTSQILQEGVLNDNILIRPEIDKVFKGNYIAIIKEYRFKNEWSNSEHIIKFRSEKRLESYLNKHYPNVDIVI